MPGIVTGPVGTSTTVGRQQAIVNAGKKYNVPFWVLWGVYGIETSFGANIKTSSTGAQGPFQFEPQTAHDYGYPMTNSPTDQQFAQQADAAAHYLSDLIAQAKHQGLSRNAAIDNALKRYSGGGYGIHQVRETSPQPSNPVRAVSNAVGGVIGAPEKFFDLITNPQTWLRLAEMILGGALLLMGLRSLTGASNDPVQLVRP